MLKIYLFPEIVILLKLEVFFQVFLLAGGVFSPFCLVFTMSVLVQTEFMGFHLLFLFFMPLPVLTCLQHFVAVFMHLCNLKRDFQFPESTSPT